MFVLYIKSFCEKQINHRFKSRKDRQMHKLPNYLSHIACSRNIFIYSKKHDKRKTTKDTAGDQFGFGSGIDTRKSILAVRMRLQRNP